MLPIEVKDFLAAKRPDRKGFGIDVKITATGDRFFFRRGVDAVVSDIADTAKDDALGIVLRTLIVATTNLA